MNILKNILRKIGPTFDLLRDFLNKNKIVLSILMTGLGVGTAFVSRKVSVLTSEGYSSFFTISKPILYDKPASMWSATFIILSLFLIGQLFCNYIGNLEIEESEQEESFFQKYKYFLWNVKFQSLIYSLIFVVFYQQVFVISDITLIKVSIHSYVPFIFSLLLFIAYVWPYKKEMKGFLHLSFYQLV